LGLCGQRGNHPYLRGGEGGFPLDLPPPKAGEQADTGGRVGDL